MSTYFCIGILYFFVFWFFLKELFLEMFSNLELLTRRCFKGISRVWVVVVLVLQFVVNVWAGSTSLETVENGPVLCQNETSNNEYQTESLVPETLGPECIRGLFRSLKTH